jgi:transposase InsO family protein
VFEASVYRLLKDHGLITGPAFILMKAADRFDNPTTAPNQLWQTDFTYLKVISRGLVRARACRQRAIDCERAVSKVNDAEVQRLLGDGSSLAGNHRAGRGRGTTFA